MEVRPTDPFAELVLHVLAHVRTPGPLDLHDERYVAWAAARTPELSRVKVQPDAELLAGAWSDAEADVLQGWTDLHHELSGFVRTKERALAELGDEDVDDPELLARLQASSPVFTELFHAQLGLLVHWFAGLHAVHVAPALATACTSVGEHCASVLELAPSLGRFRVELAWSLGPRVRVSRRRIIVGAPAAWNDVDAEVSAVLVLHADALRRAGAEDPALARWSALVELAESLSTSSSAGARLRDAHARWLAGLELAPLCRALARSGRITAADTDALLDRPHDRGDLLRGLARARS